MSEYSTALGERIKQARVKAGFLQRELAFKVNCSRASVANYERGWQSPPVDVLADISSALGCDPGWLLTGDWLRPGALPPEIVELYKTVVSIDRRLDLLIGNGGDTRRNQS